MVKTVFWQLLLMDWEGFSIVREEDSFTVSDDDFSVGVDSDAYPVIQLVSDGVVEEGEVTAGTEGLDVQGDFEPMSPGDIIDIFGVMIKAFEGERLSYWFKMGSKSFYFSSMPGESGDMGWLENNVDLAFLKVDEASIKEAVKVKPRVVIPYGFDNQGEAEEFAAKLRDRSFDVKII